MIFQHHKFYQTHMDILSLKRLQYQYYDLFYNFLNFFFGVNFFFQKYLVVLIHFHAMQTFFFLSQLSIFSIFSGNPTNIH